MNVNNKYIVFALVCLYWTNLVAQDKFQIDNRHSEIRFSINIAGGLSKVYGAFEEFEGSVFLDSETGNIRTEAAIEVSSINTGIKGRDNHLKEEDFFDATNFPTITFISRGYRKTDDGFLLQGDLTIRGIKKTVEIKCTQPYKDSVVDIFGYPTYIFTGHLVLNRKDFNIRSTPRWNRIVQATGEMAMSDGVEIYLNIIAEKL